MASDEPAKNQPSLLDPESRGGDTAEFGFGFQELVTVAHIPGWLAHDGFTAFIREAMADTEAKFFTPGVGLRIEALEAKGERLTESKFWAEVDRFKALDKGSPGTFQWFTLATAGLSERLHPLVNGLRRVRDPFRFYGHESGVAVNSFTKYRDLVVGLGRSEDDSHFLFERVLIEYEHSTCVEAEALFVHRLQEHFPEFEEYPARHAKDAFRRVRALAMSRKNVLIARSEVEAALDAARPQDAPRKPGVVRVHTAKNDDSGPFGAIRFEWGEYFGGDSRSYPPAERWESLTDSLEMTRDWVCEQARPRRVQLTGERRLSAAFAIGSVFSAVAGFSIDVNYRGSYWSTDAYEDASTPPFEAAAHVTGPATDDSVADLVVSVGVTREIGAEVALFLEGTMLRTARHLAIHTPSPIADAPHANRATSVIKQHVAKHIGGARRIHLFFAGPSPLAIFLGHRLNATAEVHCYEWVRLGEYAPTCRLKTQ